MPKPGYGKKDGSQRGRKGGGGGQEYCENCGRNRTDNCRHPTRNKNDIKGRLIMEKKTLTVDGRTYIKCNEIVIFDEGKPYTTQVILDGKPLADLGNLQSFKYEVAVQRITKSGTVPGKAKLTIVYYPKTQKDVDPATLTKK